jgi:hypothetical protein
VVRVGLALALAVVLCAAGCGKKEERKPTFPVSGKVTFQGRPATGALVVLHPLNDAELDKWPTGYPRGYVSETGAFAIGTYEQADGAPTGNYSAVIIWPAETTPGKPETGGDRLKGYYSDPKKSTFSVKVPQAPITLQPFELSSR